MKRCATWTAALSIVGISALMLGCDDDEEVVGDGGADTAGGDAATEKASLRVAHLSPDAPAVDFCVARSGSSTFTGPLLKGLGNNSGLSYGEVTQYLELDPGEYDVRLVAPAAADCSTNLSGTQDTTDLPALEAQDDVTVAAIGEVATGSAQPFRLKAFADDNTVASNKVNLRFIHASPGTGAVDVGLLTDSTFTPLFSNVAYGNVAAGSGITDGYLETDPLTAAKISVRATGTTTEALQVQDLTIPAGRAVTVFAIGKVNEAQKPLKALICQDNASPENGKAVCTTEP